MKDIDLIRLCCDNVLHTVSNVPLQTVIQCEVDRIIRKMVTEYGNKMDFRCPSLVHFVQLNIDPEMERGLVES